MSRQSAVFLMYHELEVSGRSVLEFEPGYVRYVLPVHAFHAQMNYLKSHGWRGLSVGEAIQFPEGKNVAITFDDGCETDLLAAGPILRETGFGATFFITSGRLGTPGYLSQAQLRALSVEGFEIGCHSMSHPYLTELDDHGLRREIVDSKTQLEQIIGRTVEHFSCPGGRWNQRVIETARTAGYRTLSTSELRANYSGTDLFVLGRVAILRDMSPATFAAICDGTALTTMRAQGAVRSIAKQLLGNGLYERLRAALLHR